MRIRVSHPDQLPDLVAFLESRVSLVVQPLEADLLAIGVLGSFADGGVRVVEGYLDEWNAGSRRGAAQLVSDAPRSIFAEQPLQ